MTMTETRKLRGVSPKPYRDMILLQYRLNVTARDQMRLVGRTVYTALIVISTFLNLGNVNSGLRNPYPVTRMAVLIYAVFLLGLIWMLEDRRRGEFIKYVEEIIMRDVSIEADDDDDFGDVYIRGRYRASRMFYSRFLQIEPAIWIALTAGAIAFQVIAFIRL